MTLWYVLLVVVIVTLCVAGFVGLRARQRRDQAGLVDGSRAEGGVLTAPESSAGGFSPGGLGARV